MAYSENLIHQLEREHAEVDRGLGRVLAASIRGGYALNDERAKEHVLHGACRRLKILKRCLANVFELFPPSRTRPLEHDDLNEVQISLHAFVMNLYGLFENLAWAFIIRHGLEATLGDRKKIGMFLKSTQRHLPPELSDYLTRDAFASWHDDYLKNYRDALAHRIPLYIPPARLTDAEAARHRELEQEIAGSMQRGDWEQLSRLQDAQDELGVACPMFIHSFADGSRPIYLHPQMLCDAKSAIEFCDLYFAHWDRHTVPQPVS